MKTRIQCDLDEVIVAQLDRLKAQTGASTRAEAIRSAIKAYAYLCDGRQNGKTIVMRDTDGSLEVVCLL